MGIVHAPGDEPLDVLQVLPVERLEGLRVASPARVLFITDISRRPRNRYITPSDTVSWHTFACDSEHGVSILSRGWLRWVV